MLPSRGQPIQRIRDLLLPPLLKASLFSPPTSVLGATGPGHSTCVRLLQHGDDGAGGVHSNAVGWRDQDLLWSVQLPVFGSYKPQVGCSSPFDLGTLVLLTCSPARGQLPLPGAVLAVGDYL